MYIDFIDMSVAGVVIRLALGMVIGFCIGLTGVGGGVLMLPALTLLLGIQPVLAVGTTSLFAFLTKISATFHHAKLKTIDWNISLRLLAGAVPANIAVSLWISRQGKNDAFQLGLKRFIIGVVLFSAIVMILNMIRQSRVALKKDYRTLGERISGHNGVRTGIGILMGIIAGGLIGATSIGGGVLIVPMLIILFNLPASRTAGSSIFIAVVLTMLTSLIYGKGGEADKVTALIMAVGSLAGVSYGSRLSTTLPERLLKSVVVALILAAAILMLLNQ